MLTLARASLLAIALVACAWFVLGFRQARDIGRATAIVNRTSTLDASDAAQARSLIQSADTLNPDLTPDLLRSQLALDENDNGTAERILSRVTRSEPMNIEAWVQLAVAANQTGDKGTFARAARTVGKLEPRIKPGP
jgi:Flp pilus assembly protein TadD